MEYKNDIYDKPECKCKDSCDKDCNIYTGVDIPVEVTPVVDIGDVQVVCSGDPVVKTEHCHDNTLKFVITQQIIVKIPVCYKVRVETGECKANQKDK